MVVSSHISLRVVKTIVDEISGKAMDWAARCPAEVTNNTKSLQLLDKQPEGSGFQKPGRCWPCWHGESHVFFWRKNPHSAEVVGAFVQFTGKSVGRHRADRGGIVIHGDLTMFSKGFNHERYENIRCTQFIHDGWGCFGRWLVRGLYYSTFFYVGKSMNWISTWKLTFFWAG